MHQLVKWLLFGCSSETIIDEFSIPPEFNETFIIITPNRLFIFSQSATRDFFYELTSKISNVELFITSKSEEEISETLEIQKISKFIQWTCPFKKFGIPLDQEQRHNIVLLDKWPLLTATALDCLGLGFFTMNHEIVDISKELEIYYHRIDISAMLHLLNAKTEFLENTYTDFINYFQREPINKRLNTTEDNLNLNQNLELIRINYMKEKGGIYNFLKDFPDPRVLYGTNTNKNKKESCSTEPLFKTVYDFKFPAFHMTYENMDPTTGIRICRTIFLYNLQETYFDLNEETFKHDYLNSKAYKEVFYFFNLYYILVTYFREIQHDIILFKTNIPKVKENLLKKINDFISKYIKDNDIKITESDILLKTENIIVEMKKYVLLDVDKTTYQQENKTIVLRFEVKNILSPYTHRQIGSLIFGDSFLHCYNELFDITSDIQPFKFIQISTQHFKDDSNYNLQQIILSITKIKVKDIDYKALQFYKDEYNLNYMFPDGHQDNLDHNQMFIFYSGRINLYEDYLTFNDDSVGTILVSYENIKEIDYSEEKKYIVVLFKFNDTKCLPLSGIVKDEILVYLKGSSERLRAYSRELIDYLRDNNNTNEKIKSLNEDKKFEYEIVMKTMNENEFYNLSNISNSYNLTNICDQINEMVDYEYLKYSHERFITYKDYKTKKEDFLNDNEKEKNITNKKIMFVFGTNPNDINNIKKKLVDFTKKSGLIPNVIIPPLSLFNFSKSKLDPKSIIIKFYADKINKIASDKKTINFLFIYHSCNVLNFLNELSKKVLKLASNFDILNISYSINYSWIKSDRFKNKINHNIIYDDIINYIFVDEGILAPDKITKNNKIVSMANPNAKLFTTRSFYLNEKEVRKIFETILIKPKMLKFYMDYYENISSNQAVYQNLFIPFKYMVKEDLIKKFLNISLNTPLLSKWKINNEVKFPPEDEPKPKLSDDNEYQKYLQKIVSISKVSEIEPVFLQIFGNCVKNTEENVKNSQFSGKRVISEIVCNYKNKSLTDNKDLKYKETKNELGIFVLGKNLALPEGDDFYNKVLLTLAGELTPLRPYQKKEDITEEERANLNFVNLTRPLPEGWSLAGPVVVDEKDEIHYEHPYLEKFIDEYIEMNNKAIDEYNNNVKKEIEKLLV